NVVERAVIISSGANLELPSGDFKCTVAGDTPTLTRTLDEVQRYRILEALRQSGGVVAGRNGAAVRLGLARATLQYRMRKLGIAQDRVVRSATWPWRTHCIALDSSQLNQWSDESFKEKQRRSDV